MRIMHYMSDTHCDDIGERICSARQAAKMSRADLAESLGIDVSVVCRIEHGQVNLSACRAVEISNLFKIDLDWLLRGGKKLRRRTGS